MEHALGWDWALFGDMITIIYSYIYTYNHGTGTEVSEGIQPASEDS